MEIFTKACPGWVEIVENKAQDKTESEQLVEKYLNEIMQNKPERLVLGCTHYPFLKNILSKFVETAMLIDPAEYFATFIKQDLEQNLLLSIKEEKGKDSFFVSANPEQFKVSAQLFYEIAECPILV